MEIKITPENMNCVNLHNIILENLKDKDKERLEYDKFYKYADKNQKAFFLKNNLIYIISLIQKDEFDKLYYQLQKFNKNIKEI